MIPDGTPTGLYDRYKQPIYVGDRVQDLDGRIGTVVFAHGAVRVDAYNAVFLCYNSSLMFSDSQKPTNFMVLR